MIPFSVIELIPILQLILLVTMALIGPLVPSRFVVKMYSFIGLTLVMVSAYILLQYTSTYQGFLYQLGGYDRSVGVELKIDSFSAFFVFFISVFVWLIHIYSWISVKMDIPLSQHRYYYSLLHLMFFAMFGLLYSNDLFNMYVFIEILSISAGGIISISRKHENYMAAFRYLMLNTLASISIMFGIALIYMLTGALNLMLIAERLVELVRVYPVNVTLGMGFIGIGLAIKSAIFPFHEWLPDAYSSASASASAILSGIMTKLYLLTLLKLMVRLFTLDVIRSFSIPFVMMVFAGVAMIMGSLFALGQKEIKRMLAYSSVSQVGYILLGFSLFTLGGLVATFYYMISHAFLKGLLFLVAGMAQNMKGIRTIKATEGMGYAMPITMILFTFASFGMVGIPGTSGFIAKLQLSLAFMDASRGGFVALIIVSGILNALYFFPIFMKSFFQEEDQAPFTLEKIPFAMGLTLTLFVLIILTLGFFPGFILPWIESAASSLLGIS